jgi:hypothetical protein
VATIRGRCDLGLIEVGGRENKDEGIVVTGKKLAGNMLEVIYMGYCGLKLIGSTCVFLAHKFLGENQVLSSLIQCYKMPRDAE